MRLLISCLQVLQLAILFRVLLTWIIRNPYDRRFISFTAPIDAILKPFKVVIPMGGAFLDLGPVLALVTLQILERILISF
ncbi:MAG: YggT family protein [Candidatus Ozemobacteraceae bacterium]